MTREEYLKVCKVCKNRRYDYDQDWVCSLTNKIADFEEKCDHFNPDDVPVAMASNEDQAQLSSQSYSRNDIPETPAWRTILSVVLAIIAVIRLVIALSK